MRASRQKSDPGAPRVSAPSGEALADHGRSTV